jgi:hypothetical protein
MAMHGIRRPGRAPDDSMTRMTEADLEALADMAKFAERGERAQAAADAIITPRRGRARRGHPEDDLQRAVIEWWELRYPDTWRKTWHTPNGLAARTRALAAIFKGLGVKPGVFDLVCIARRGPYTGFALELKAGARGRVSASQDDWLARYTSEGWYACVAFDIDAALAAIDRYHAFPAHTPE